MMESSKDEGNSYDTVPCCSKNCYENEGVEDESPVVPPPETQGTVGKFANDLSTIVYLESKSNVGSYLPLPYISNTQVIEQVDTSTLVMDKLKAIPCAGIILAMISGIFFAVAGFIVKLTPGINAVEIVVTRSIVQLLFYIPAMIYWRDNPWGEKGERVNLFLRGVFGFLSQGLCYVAYRMIPLADASAIVFSAPVYTSIFACLLLREECGFFQVYTIAITVLGVVLISKPSFIFGTQPMINDMDSNTRLEGTLLAFVSSCCAAATFVMIRRLPRTSSAVVIFWFSVVCLVMGSLTLVVVAYYFPNSPVLAKGIRLPENYIEILYLLANGMCGVLAQLCLTLSLKIEEAGLVSLARTVDIVMAFIFQAAFLREEVVMVTSIIGAVVISSAVSVSALRKWLKEKNGKWNIFWLIINCGISRPGDGDDDSSWVSHVDTANCRDTEETSSLLIHRHSSCCSKNSYKSLKGT